MNTKGTNGSNPDGAQSSSGERKVYPLTGDIIKRGEDLLNDRLMAHIGRPDLMTEAGRRKYEAEKENK